MSKPGSHIVDANKVTGAMMDLGASCLETKAAAWVASYGDCFLDYKKAAEEIPKRPDGSRYHRGSIARACRRLKRWGLMTINRVWPQHVPKGAKWTTPHGTTDKSINFEALGLRPSMSRGRRRARRFAQDYRPPVRAMSPSSAAAASSSTPPPPSSPRPAPAMLAELVKPNPDTLAAMQATLAMMGGRTRSQQRPIDRHLREQRLSEDELREKAQRDIARLAELERKERGPP